MELNYVDIMRSLRRRLNGYDTIYDEDDILENDKEVT